MKNHKPYLIGLTGGIGSGKSTVSNLFKTMGTEVIDADEISRQLVASGTPLLEVIAGHFGNDVIDDQGGLDRSALRQIVFNHPEEKIWLEALLHPVIREEIQRQIDHCRGDYVILVVPLLLESGQYDYIDRILVVDIPEAMQVDRTAQRDGSPETLVQQIIDSQVSRQARLSAADDVIDNTISPDDLEHRVRQLHEQYQKASQHAH